MNYELAKQLKEAGFPIKNEEVEMTEEGMGGRVKMLMPMMPTLSELIETCGDGFASLDKEEIGWRAYADRGKWREDLKDYCEPGCCGFAEGSTREEAVAQLWLKLQEK